MPTETTPAVCSHGSLRRSCEICERDKEIERLRAELEKAREALNHLVYRNKDDGSWRCAFYGDQNITKWVNDAMLSAAPVPQNGEGE